MVVELVIQEAGTITSMNIFKIVRLVVWGALVAICIVITCLYLAINQTFLTRDGLTTVVKESRVADTVRSEILLPKILQTTRASDYSTLLDDKTVTEAFNSAVSTEVLTKKLQPAVDSLQKWLNSEEPKIVFSIDMSDLSDTFAATLADKVNTKVASLPRCTAQNTIAQAESGVCRSTVITANTLSKQIEEMIKTDPTLASNVTITPESIQLSPSIQRNGSDLPSYLNLLYAAAIVAAGVTALVSLWLLFKHRLAGVITLGASALLGGIGLFIIATLGAHAAGSFSSDSQVQQLARAGASAFEAAVQRQFILLFIGGIIALLIGVTAAILLRRRRASHQSMHLSGH